MKRTGILGGTFDPIHLGHLIIAEWVREEVKLEEVWFMPSHTPTYKVPPPEASPEQRLEMVRLAVRDGPHFRVEDEEIRRGGATYTAETMERLAARHPDREFYYIIGADMVAFLPRWHRIDDLLRMVRFVGVRRDGFDLRAAVPEAARDRVLLVDAPYVGISSTVVRQRLKGGKSVRYLIPAAVEQYIRENGLYG